MKGSNIFWFIGGAVTGSLVAWQLLKKHYAKIADEEIRSVKDAFKEQNKSDWCQTDESAPDYIGKKPSIPKKEDESSEELKEIAHSATNKPDILAYRERAHEYTTEPMRPYLISEDEYGNCDYETISMTLYSDEVLADDGDYVVENVEEIVGESNIEFALKEHLDMFWIRNDERRCDYEIACDSRAFAEVVGN